MNADRWIKLQDIFHRALSHAPAERDAFLDDACGDDQEMRREIASLLAHAESDTNAIENPVLGLAAEWSSPDSGRSLVGRHIPNYQVLSLIGSGGMGEVYQALDVRLNRRVAIKLLPKAFADDPERLARFRREVQLLASLNHPNIAAVYGLEESDGVLSLVMEFIPGETLAERLARTRLDIHEALRISAQIAEALEAAHDKGIIHRDLKPANIKITPDGKVKVLDFGLAKAFQGEAGNGDLTAAPVLTRADAGVWGPAGSKEVAKRRTEAIRTVGPTLSGHVWILGTPAYMSPEQARGKSLDARADIWSFGCVLYEMFASQRAFHGDTSAETISKVLEREPNWESLPERIPPGIKSLLHRCLQKDAQRRLRHIGDARIEIEETVHSAPAAGTSGEVHFAKGHRLAWVGVFVLIAVAGIGAMALSSLRRSRLPALAPVTRAVLTLPPSWRLVMNQNALAISPNGALLAYAAQRGESTQLFVHALNEFQPRPVPGSEGARYPFFSPDSLWVAFFTRNSLQKVSVTGGAPVPICAIPEGNRRGGAWAPDQTIVFTGGAPGGLWKVSAAGGTPEELTRPDTIEDTPARAMHVWPHFLPDGQNVIFSRGTLGQNGLALLSLETKQWRPMAQFQAKQARYISTGHVLYVQEGAVRAVPFDAAGLQLSGSPIPVLDPVFDASNGGATYFAVSDNGTLVYVPGGTDYSMVWVDRLGRILNVTDDRRGFRNPELSPDGQHIAVTVDPPDQGNSSIWIYDVLRGAGSRLTSEGHNLAAVWTPDGKRVAFSSSRAGSAGADLHWQSASGGPLERLLTRPAAQYPTSFTSDERNLAFNADATAGSDIWVMPMEGDRAPLPVVVTPFNEAQAVFSSDGNWLAYQSDESGRNEIYVQAFRGRGPGGRIQISSEGGTNPVWSSDGSELFYRNGTRMMTVPVKIGPVFSAGKPQVVFENASLLGSGADTSFDVSSDGQRFLMVQSSDEGPNPTQIRVVLNWFSELRQRTK